MIRASAIVVLLFASPSNAQDTDDEIVFVNSITVKTPDLSEREIQIANRYAHCVSFPYFPVKEELTNRARHCRQRLPARPAKRLSDMADRIDAIVGNNPGSEATLTIVRVPE